MSKKILTLVLASVLVFCMFSVSVFAAEENVVFMDVNSGDDDYDGCYAETPKKSFGAVDGKGVASVLATFGKEGGTLVVSGKVRPGANYTLPAMEGPLTITAAWNGVDYRVTEPVDNPASGSFKAAGAISLTLGTDTTFTDIILFQEGVTQNGRQNTIVVPSGLTLTITDTVILMTMPGTDAYWKVLVEEGGTAVLSTEALKLMTIENYGTVKTYGDPNGAPVVITTAVETTAAPVETTAAPAETTAAPVVTTAAPVETTTAAPETTAAPAKTTEAPDTTTAVPATTKAPASAPDTAGGVNVGMIVGIAVAVVAVAAIVIVVAKKKKTK